MCNCFLGNAENFIFDPKCKPSDTPDCDWHVSRLGMDNTKRKIMEYNYSIMSLPPLKLGYEWVITSHTKPLVRLVIHASN